MEIKELLLMCIDKGASDLHITENEPPILRIDGSLRRMNLPVLDKQALKVLIYGILNNSQKEIFEKELELDFSLALPGLDRFRVNVHMQKSCPEAAFRRVPLEGGADQFCNVGAVCAVRAPGAAGTGSGLH